jgi:hypothetical protein
VEEDVVPIASELRGGEQVKVGSGWMGGLCSLRAILGCCIARPAVAEGEGSNSNAAGHTASISAGRVKMKRSTCSPNRASAPLT